MGVLAFGEFEVDLDLFQLRYSGDAVEISAKGFDLLVYLIRHRERVVSKQELLSQVCDVSLSLLREAGVKVRQVALGAPGGR